ncbi:LacI family DNA-binding transcriptional regulator [Nakamurella panacisegetis]|nr:LacI family DNA-binding transcriptional regulator [Nakamurella panacisegetis]
MSSKIRRRPPGAPTLSAIAEAAGVALPTVSKVLNGRSDVSDSTRLRVTQMLRQGGYELDDDVDGRSDHPQDAAGGLVDLVAPGIEGSWATSMLAGVEEVVSRAGRDVVVTLARETGPGEASWADRLVARGCRGAVLALVTPTRAQRRLLAAANVELVMLDPGAEPVTDLATVGATNWSGGYSATEYLVSLGHRRIGIIGGLPIHLYSKARLDGYRSALSAAGIAWNPDLVREADWTRAGAFDAATDLLAQAQPPTAIFACSDRMALGVYEAAASVGLSIPGQLSVVGFDDLPEARWLSPALTTVRQPVREMGRTAATMLLRLLNGEELETQRLELATVLMPRASATPPDLGQ